MSLYRKYRPKNFPDLIGQEHIKVTLLNAIKAGTISHAYLFTGPRGTGKTTTARLLAKAINAEIMTEDGRFDGSEIAEEIDNGRLIDVIEIDAASNRGIDEIRDLREKISYAPTRAKNKVYIIDEVHMLTKEAFNALLKTLEEPPSFVFFILATTEIQKVPETIISRCQRFDFRRVSEQVLVEHLRQVALLEEIIAEEEALLILAKHARGGVRDALTLLEQISTNSKLESARVKEVLGISNLLACDNLYEDLKKGKAAEAMDQLHAVFQSGVDLVQFNRDFLDYLRQRMLTAVKNGENAEARRFIELIGFFQESYEKQKFSYIPELPLEVAIARACLGEDPRAASGIEADDGSKKKPEVISREPNVAENKPVVGASTVTPPAAQNTVAANIEETVQQPSAEPISADLEGLLKNWTAVVDRVHHPLAQRCLKAGTPVQLIEEELTLAFQNNFNKDKLFVPELLALVEQAIEETCQRKLKLVGMVDPSLVKPAIPVNSNEVTTAAGDSPDSEADRARAPKENLLESALNVFGGELV